MRNECELVIFVDCREVVFQKNSETISQRKILALRSLQMPDCPIQESERLKKVYVQSISAVYSSSHSRPVRRPFVAEALLPSCESSEVLGRLRSALPVPPTGARSIPVPTGCRSSTRFIRAKCQRSNVCNANEKIHSLAQKGKT